MSDVGQEIERLDVSKALVEQKVNALIAPRAGLDILSRAEVTRLGDASRGDLHELLRRCSLAVLMTGSDSDDPRETLRRHADFQIRVVQQDRGIKLELKNAPAAAFVDGQIIRGVADHLFAVVRDIAYTAIQVQEDGRDLSSSEGLTNAVFEILRNARSLQSYQDPNIAVCWGGHSIGRDEYLYTKKVGYEMGLRGLDICTGCGPGAMKGPMKGATIAHAKQRCTDTRYIGVTEPGIIAAESPNPIVNQLIIMPDIEKRLEAFVRLGHGFIVFPGGVGTAEEILYLLGILLHPDNARVPFPLVFTGPAGSADYFEQIDRFIRDCLGDAVASKYEIIIDNPSLVALRMKEGMKRVKEHRVAAKDAFFFNWSLHIPYAYQQPFIPTHEAMAGLNLNQGQPVHDLAADLRRAFSGIVAGNVKEQGMIAIEKHGPFKISGDAQIMAGLDGLLRAFVEQRRMKITGQYRPCYELAC